jgi:hypothetical protein
VEGKEVRPSCSEEKEAKRLYDLARVPSHESFLVLFFKKELLPF